MLSTPVLEKLLPGGNFAKPTFSMGIFPTIDLTLLKAEVQDGKCCVGFVDDEVVRVVFIAALQIRVGEDRFLVRIAERKRDDGQMTASCVLPGTKQREEEPPVTA